MSKSTPRPIKLSDSFHRKLFLSRLIDCDKQKHGFNTKEREFLMELENGWEFFGEDYAITVKQMNYLAGLAMQAQKQQGFG